MYEIKEDAKKEMSESEFNEAWTILKEMDLVTEEGSYGEAYKSKTNQKILGVE